MAIYSNGILGEFRGKVGSVVGSSWNGIPVIRKVPVRKETEYSDLQKQQWAKFRLMTGFLRPLTELFNQTFKNSAVGMTCYNKAFSENSQAITGEYPAISIDYPQIVLSKGRLPYGEPPTISSPEEGKLLLTWKTGDGIDEHLTEWNCFYCSIQRRAQPLDSRSISDIGQSKQLFAGCWSVHRQICANLHRFYFKEQ